MNRFLRILFPLIVLIVIGAGLWYVVDAKADCENSGRNFDMGSWWYSCE